MIKKIEAEINKISKLDKNQKWDYFKSYYMVKCILLFIGLLLFIWFVKDVFFQKKAVNAGCVYGVEISDEEKNALTDGFLEYYNYDKKKYCAYISTDNMFEGTAQQMDANAHEMALFAQIAAGEIYYLILDKDTFFAMKNGGIYLTLDEAFPEGLKEPFRDSTVELTDEETGESHQVGIDLKKAGILDDGREGYLVFTVGIPDKNYPGQFLDYLMSM